MRNLFVLTTIITWDACLIAGAVFMISQAPVWWCYLFWGIVFMLAFVVPYEMEQYG